jgi:hypothetical protein
MRRIGNSLLLLLVVAVPCATSGSKKHQDAEPYGLVAGTVFRNTGYALPGAKVAISADPQTGQTPVKIQYPRAISDARGEFAFRVPISAMRYTVRAEMKGFEPQQKSVDMEGEIRMDVSLILQPSSK